MLEQRGAHAFEHLRVFVAAAAAAAIAEMLDGLQALRQRWRAHHAHEAVHDCCAGRVRPQRRVAFACQHAPFAFRGAHVQHQRHAAAAVLARQLEPRAALVLIEIAAVDDDGLTAAQRELRNLAAALARAKLVLRHAHGLQQDPLRT